MDFTDVARGVALALPIACLPQERKRPTEIRERGIGLTGRLVHAAVVSECPALARPIADLALHCQAALEIGASRVTLPQRQKDAAKIREGDRVDRSLAAAAEERLGLAVIRERRVVAPRCSNANAMLLSAAA